MELLNKEKSICSTCRQEIKDDKIKEHLRTFYKKELDKFQERANKLKEDVQTYIKEKTDLMRSVLTLTSSVLFSRAVASQVFSTMRSLTSVFEMGTGGTFSLSPLVMV